MKSILFLLLFFATICCSPTKSATKSTTKPIEIKNQWPIMQSVTDNSSTLFVIQKKKNEALQYSYFDKTWKKINSIKSFQLNGSDTVIEHLKVTSLRPNKKYKLKVRSNSQSDIRTFKILNSKNSYKIAAASCMADTDPKTANSIMTQMSNAKVDFFFLIGDNVYIDFDPNKFIKLQSVNQNTVWKRHTQARQFMPIFYMKNLKPVLSSWDDHDYGQNDGNRHFKHKVFSLNTFKIFFGLKDLSSPLYKKGPGLSYVFNTNTQQFIFLDNRYFRDKKGSGSHWGKEQEKWLISHLEQSESPSWIINGDQFWGGYHPFESYEGDRPTHFKNMMSQLAKASKHPLVFLTGDRHLSEIMELKKPDFPYKTFEITTSPLHAKLYPSRWETRPNKRQVQGIDLVHNYTLIRTETKDGSLKVKASAIGPKHEILYTHQFKVTKKTAKKN